MKSHRLPRPIVVMDVNDSAAGGPFGYYVAGQDGTTFSIASGFIF
jgi:hypothetical protein